jgi:cell division protein FtsZ
MPDDAYKRNMDQEQWMEKARNKPAAEQNDQWALLHNEVAGTPEFLAQSQADQINQRSSGWGQRYTDGEPLSSSHSPFAFEAPMQAPHHVDIVVVGVGGGGMNAINRMINTHVRGVRFVAMNTDAQVLALCQAPDRICLGQHHTKGLGAGGNASVGMRAATESTAEIQEVLGNADLVFIAAGMGGGTGTGAAPVVASIAKKMGALTVGIVTLPFTFEGTRRRRIAEQGLAELSAEIDALITVPNDRLLSTMARDRNLSDAFKVADDILRQGVQGIAEVINVPGMVNVDFADVRSVLREAGSALMSLGQGTGPERAQQAAEEAIAGGFLNVTIRGAKRVLFNISGGEDMTLFEVNEVAERIGSAIDDTADIIFGAVIDPALEDTIRVTLIAAGMEELHTSRSSTISSRSTSSSPYSFQTPSGPPFLRRSSSIGDASRAAIPTPAQPITPTPRIPGSPQLHAEQSPERPPAARQYPGQVARAGQQGQARARDPQTPPPPGNIRQQRSLNDLRGIRGMGNAERRQEPRRYQPAADDDGPIDPPPFLKRYEHEEL